MTSVKLRSEATLWHEWFTRVEDVVTWHRLVAVLGCQKHVNLRAARAAKRTNIESYSLRRVLQYSVKVFQGAL